MSAASDADRLSDAEWRRRRLWIAVATFGVIVLVGVVLGLVSGQANAIALLPFLAVIAGLVLSRARRDSPLGPGIMRGGALVLWLYVVWLVAVLLVGAA